MQVEDFLDRSQNFARSVGKVQMQKICKCLRQCALNLLDFMRGKVGASKLKTLLFGQLSPDELVSKPRLRHSKRKKKWDVCPQGRYAFQKRARHGGNATTSRDSLPDKVFPHALNDRSPILQSSIHHFVPVIPWPSIIPSGFGYGLSLEFASVAPHPGRGILGRPPSNLAPLNRWNSNQLVERQEVPHVPMQSQRTFQHAAIIGSYNRDEQIRCNENLR